MGGFEEHRKDWESSRLGGQPRTPSVTPEQSGRKILLRSQLGKSVGNDDQRRSLGDDQLSQFSVLRVPSMQNLEC